LCEIHIGTVGEITALQHRGREAKKKANALLALGDAVQLEVFLETHSTGHESQQRHPHAQWCSGYRRYSCGMAGGERALTCVERKEVEAIG
jgi:hypothetical protein